MFISCCIVSWPSLPKKREKKKKKKKKRLQNMWRIGGIERIQLSERFLDPSIFVLTMPMAQNKDSCSW